MRAENYGMMNLFVTEEIGAVQAVISESKNPRYGIILSHGAGAGMNHSFMSKVADLFTENAHVLRFNFPYIDAGKKVPGSPKVSVASIQAAVDHMRKQYPTLPLFLSGKSYGGRMSSHLAAEVPKLPINGLIYLGFPLHAPGRDGIGRAKHLVQVKVPQLFIQGSNDKLANIKLIKEVAKKLKADLIEIEHADHSFKIAKKLGGNLEGTLSGIVKNANKWALKRL